MNNELGLCQCGCGQKTNNAKKTNSRCGVTKGQPARFISGHNCHGPLHYNWNGGNKLSDGYMLIWKPDHHRADTNGYVREQILIAEEILGKPLPEGAVVHHVNENRADNRKENLIICQDQAYHLFLHRRMQALKACGNANWRKCQFCKIYDDPENLFITKQNTSHHRECRKEYNRLKYLEIREDNYERRTASA